MNSTEQNPTVVSPKVVAIIEKKRSRKFQKLAKL